MSVFDIVIALLFLLEAVNGFRHGFVEMMFFTAAIFIALYAAKSFSGLVVGWIDTNSAFAEHLAYILVFVATIVLVIVLAKLSSVIIEGAGLGVANRLGGVAMGLVRCVLILGFLFIVFEGINQRERFVCKNTLESTFFYTPILTAGEFMLPYLSLEKVKEVLHEFSIPKKEVEKEDDGERTGSQE